MLSTLIFIPRQVNSLHRYFHHDRAKSSNLYTNPSIAQRIIRLFLKADVANIFIALGNSSVQTLDFDIVRLSGIERGIWYSYC
jgi:hypothetical protein